MSVRMAKPSGPRTDEELIAAFQDGNESAFAELVGRYKDPLTNFVYRFVGDWEDCTDIVQETFVRVFKSRHSYKPVAKFSTWIYTIAGNLAKTSLRRKRIRFPFSRKESRDSEREVEIVDEAAGPDLRADASLKEERIQDALERLSVKYREVIIMREIQELSYEEISAICGVRIGTVKSRLNRARSQLQRMLRDIWDE